MSDGRRPAVTVAVVSWNTRELLDACLASLRADADAGLVDVWVHDNGSSDGSPDLVAERHPWARLVRGENIGYGRAVNRVAEQTDSAWIAPANADVRVTPGAVAAMLEAARADPRAVAVAPRLVLPDGSTQPSLASFPTVSRALWELTMLDRRGPRRVRLRVHPHWDMETGRVVEWAAGAFFLVRHDAFAAVGGFDEEQWMYAEDLDLCWRMARDGGHMRYVPGAVVHHEHSAAADVAFGGRDEVIARQQAANWAWSVRRLGRWRTALIAVLGLVEGAVLAVAAAALRRDEEARLRARGGVLGAIDGLRAAVRR